MYNSSEKNDLIKSLYIKTKLTSILLSEHTTQDEFNTFMNVFGQSLSHLVNTEYTVNDIILLFYHILCAFLAHFIVK